MLRRPATITQADIARAVRAVKQAGAVEVEVHLEDGKVIARFAPSQSTCDRSALEPEQEITKTAAEFGSGAVERTRTSNQAVIAKKWVKLGAAILPTSARTGLKIIMLFQ
jgi:hypothetical protein